MTSIWPRHHYRLIAVSETDLFEPHRRRTLVLRKGRERAIANRHPWIFEGAIASEAGPNDAAIATLVDERGTHLAAGLYSRDSQIRLRALTFGEEPLSFPTVFR